MHIKHRMLFILLGIIMLISGCQQKKARKPVPEDSITLGYGNWASSVAQTHVIKHSLEQKGFQVHMRQMEGEALWKALQEGEIDGMVSAWLPKSHEQYYQEVKNDIIDLGPNFEGAKMGLVVPKYVKIADIEELRLYRKKFHEKIYGVYKDSGIMKHTERVNKEYKLDYEIIEETEEELTKRLKEAIDKEEWIVITGWVPHWMFQIYDLRFLEDTQKIYGGSQAIHTLVKKDLESEKPKAYEVLDNFYLTHSDMTELLFVTEGKTGKEYDKKVEEWVKLHEDQVEGW